MMDSSVLDESREPLKLPAFEKAVMQSVTRALEQWRDEAMEGELPLLALKPLSDFVHVDAYAWHCGRPSCTFADLPDSKRWRAC